LDYQHTQKGTATRYVAIFGLGLLAAGTWLPLPRMSPWFLVFGALFLLLSLCFARLTVRDRGNALSARFGPLPLFGTKIPYDEVTAVRVGQSDWVDGSGVHWVPGRGWIFNLGPGDCIEIDLGERTVRIGTDDADALLHFLRRKTGARRGR